MWKLRPVIKEVVHKKIINMAQAQEHYSETVSGSTEPQLDSHPRAKSSPPLATPR